MKIKKFAKEYIAKVIRKIKEKRKRKQQQHQTSVPGSGSSSRRGSFGGWDPDADDLDEGEGEEMSAEVLKNVIADTIGLCGDDDGESQDDEEGDMEIDDHESTGQENLPDDTDIMETVLVALDLGNKSSKSVDAA